MPVTPVQRGIFEDRMNRGDLKHLNLTKCQVCYCIFWKMGEIIDCPTPQPVPYEHRVPMVQIICKECGHVTLYSAKFFGLMPEA
jgi:hypothetical protein